MTNGMKMLLIANRSGGENPSSGRGGSGREGARNEYGRSEMGYDRAENNDMNDMNTRMGGDEMENRRGGQRRSRDSRGRFAPRDEYMGMEMTGDPWDAGGREQAMSYVPPVYENSRRNDEYRPMNKIGFSAGDEMGQEYHTYAGYQRPEEVGHRASAMTMGRASSTGNKKLTKEMADEWMEGLQNEDGSRGPHWTLEQVKQVMAQKGVKAEPLEFFAIINSMYADYCKVFKKYGVGDKLDFYVDMTKAFIEDKDAGEGKVAKYFENIVMK